MNTTTTRRGFIKGMGAGAAAAAFPSILTARERSVERPNILFVMSDDHATNAMSCYGSVINRTPNLDRIAYEGMRFDNCYCTNAICAPSRAIILTGKYSHKNGVTDNRETFDGSQQTYTKLLRQAGYQTAMIGKWHLKSDPTGFDYWNVLPGQGSYYNPDMIDMGERKRYRGYVTDIITDLTLKWLNERDRSRPFCLLCQHKAPHRNWMPAPEYMTKYDDVTIPIPPTFNDDYRTRSDAARKQEMEIGRHMFDSWDLKLHPKGTDLLNIDRSWQNEFARMTPEQQSQWNEVYGPKNDAFRRANLSGQELREWKYQRYIKDYLRCIASVDDNVGRILQYLDAENIADNTIVVYTSDQGFFLGEHGWFDKRFMYEESLRMPFLVRYPNMTGPGNSDTDIVINEDFAPTFLDAAGVSIPSDMQGRSLTSLLRGRTPSDWRDAMYYHYYEYPASHMVRRHYGIRTKRYKLIHFYHDIDAWELYDLRKDPRELNNVYGNAAYTPVVTELKGRLKQLQEYYDDPIRMEYPVN